jgi:deoxycytidylate deaminase
MFTNYDYKMFNVAKAVARTSTHKRAMIGAAIVNGKDIVSVGVNGKKSHPLQQYYNKFRFHDNDGKVTGHLMHAELDAIIKARSYLKNHRDAKIYVYRQLRTGELGMCRPCAGCIQALKDHGISEIYYTSEQGYVYECVTV